MKRKISGILVTVLILSALAGCKTPENNSLSAASASAVDFLVERLGSTDGITVGTETEAAAYGIDMTDFRDEGYIIRTVDGETVIFGKTEDGLDRGVRYYANYCTDSDNADIVYGEGAKVKSLTIGGRDIAAFDIYLFEGADQCHTYAATELQTYIEIATGIKLDIVREPAEHMIALEQVMPEDPRFETLGDDGFTIEVRDDGNLYIVGGRWRGCMNGAYELLEYIGFRFVGDFQVQTDYTSEDMFLYEAEHVDIPADYSDTQVPTFELRQGRSSSTYLAIANKDNAFITGNAKYNGYGYHRAANHGLLLELFSKGYFEDYLSYDVLTGLSQPCFTDEVFIEGCIEYYTEIVDSRIAAGQQIGRELVSIDVAQNDNMDFCICESCLEYIQSEGSHTGPVLYFTNSLAEVFKETHPGLWLNMLVYSGTDKPPKTMMPLDNINCSYCYWVTKEKVQCYNHGISGDDCGDEIKKDGLGLTSINNSLYSKDLERWCEIASRVTVWTYPGNWYYADMPSYCLDLLLDDMRYLADLGVIYGLWPCLYAGKMGIQEMLTCNLLDMLSWDAYMTREEYNDTIKEMLYIFYGDAGQYIWEYFEWQESVNADGCWTTLGVSNPSERLKLDKIRNDFEYTVALFEKAIELAPTAQAEKSLILESRKMYFSGLICVFDSWYVNGTEESRARYTELYYHFKDIALATGFDVCGGSNLGVNIRLTEEDFDIEKNLASLYPTGGSDWYKVG